MDVHPVEMPSSDLCPFAFEFNLLQATLTDCALRKKYFYNIAIYLYIYIYIIAFNSTHIC